MYKQAHRCKHGGDRGNYRDFIVFARLLDSEFIRSRLGPSVTAIAVQQNSCEEVIISEDPPEVSHVVLVKLRVEYARSSDGEPLAESTDAAAAACALSRDTECVCSPECPPTASDAPHVPALARNNALNKRAIAPAGVRQEFVILPYVLMADPRDLVYSRTLVRRVSHSLTLV